jgi:aconitate hydratase 2/2-methylisocitrate dehydratase
VPRLKKLRRFSGDGRFRVRLPIELDVSNMQMGDVIDLRPYDGKPRKDGKVIAEFKLKSDVLFDEVRAGGRIPLIVR